MNAEDPPKDVALRDDVRRLGALVGEMLRDQEGDAFFDLVEETRLAAIAARDDPRKRTALDRVIGRVAAEQRETLVRAFSAYFGAVNMGEQIHRLRRRREYERGAPQPDGPLDVLRRLKDEGHGAAEIVAAFAALDIEPVFTAHPTEAVRRTLLTKQQRIARALVDRIEPTALTPAEERRAWDRIREEITAAWQTEEHLDRRPTLDDEVEHVLFYLRRVIYRIVPPLYEAFERAFAEIHGQTTRLPEFVRFGSWVGGDMDGNPNVDAATVWRTLERQRDAILGLYRDEAGRLIDHLSQSVSRTGFGAEFKRRMNERSAEFPEVIERIPVRHREMPYRVMLHCVRAKLRATMRGEPRGYGGPLQLQRDVESIGDSLLENRAAQAGLHRVVRFLRRIRTFGFHFARLDTRQDAEVYRRVRARLQRDDDEEVAGVLELFRTLARARDSFGEGAIGPTIISMAQGPDDALNVLHLARAAGFIDGGRVPLDVAPLFETVDDLDRAHLTLETMLADEPYREHVASRGNVQYVMLGYSDSGKDSGIASARWALYQAQERLVRVCDGASVRLLLFHGRGGTVSRGGTKVTEAIPAQPPGSVRSRLRVTEQGEIIHGRYGLRGIAQRTLEATTGAVLVQGTREGRLTPPRAEWRTVMDRIARAGRDAYRRLIHDDPRLFEYFRLATPIDVITRIQIGSRPSSRRRQQGIRDLRAIPWVFAWTQARQMLPGWYGVGKGLQAAVDEFGLARVREAAREWPVLRTLLGDVEMVMAKADIEIGARYAELAGDVGRKLFPELESEFRRTRELICAVRQIDELLWSEPWLARAIKLRNPYIDPMSLLQIELLREWRAGDRTDERLERALFTTVKGIARGLMNTG